MKKASTTLARLELFTKQGGKCYWCRKSTPFSSFTRDHLKTQSRGGGHSMGNLVGACATCNRLRGSMTVREWAKHIGVNASELSKRKPLTHLPKPGTSSGVTPVPRVVGSGRSFTVPRGNGRIRRRSVRMDPLVAKSLVKIMRAARKALEQTDHAYANQILRTALVKYDTAKQASAVGAKEIA